MEKHEIQRHRPKKIRLRLPPRPPWSMTAHIPKTSLKPPPDFLKVETLLLPQDLHGVARQNSPLCMTSLSKTLGPCSFTWSYWQSMLYSIYILIERISRIAGRFYKGIIYTLQKSEERWGGFGGPRVGLCTCPRRDSRLKLIHTSKY